MSFQDIYQKAIKLTEGEYTVKAQICSDNIQVLKKLQSTNMILDIALSKTFSADIYKSLSETVLGESGISKKISVRKGSRTCFFVSNLNSDIKLPKDAAPGDFLIGDFKVSELDVPKLFTAAYYVGTEFKQPEPVFEKLEPKEIKLELCEKIRDLEITYLSKLKSEDRSSLLEKLERENPLFIPLKKKKYEKFNNF